MNMEISDALKELQGHPGKWIAIKDKRILLSDTKPGLEEKLNNTSQSFQIPHMYDGYQSWKNEVEEALKELMNSDSTQKHEETPFVEEETEDEVTMHLQTEDLEEKPKKSFLERILRL